MINATVFYIPGLLGCNSIKNMQVTSQENNILISIIQKIQNNLISSGFLD